MSFVWTPDMATGDLELDRQHREILGLVMELATSVDGPSAAPDALRLLASLREQVQSHLDHEERLMASSRYPAQREHRQAHQAMRAELTALTVSFRLGKATQGLVNAVHAFANDRVLSHFRDVDSALAAHLASCEPWVATSPRHSSSPETAEAPAFDGARSELDEQADPGCLIDASNRILHCNPAWDRFAGANDGASTATGSALRGRDYLSCVAGDALVTQLGARIKQVKAGVARQIQTTCHTPHMARLITARYTPVFNADARVEGVMVLFITRHVFPIEDLYVPLAADAEGHVGPAGRIEMCSNCSRVRRRDRATPVWEFVPAYLQPGAPLATYGLCEPCFAGLFGLTRG
jgi:hemerythrin